MPLTTSLDPKQIQLIGFPMTSSPEPVLSYVASQTSVIRFRKGAVRQIGNMRSVSLEGQAMDSDQFSDAAKAIQESIDEAFGETGARRVRGAR